MFLVRKTTYALGQ